MKKDRTRGAFVILTAVLVILLTAVVIVGIRLARRQKGSAETAPAAAESSYAAPEASEGISIAPESTKTPDDKKDTPEERLCTILEDSDVFMNACAAELSGGDALTEEDILQLKERAAAYLAGQEGVVSVASDGDTILFTTDDGFTSFIILREMEEPDETEENGTESGSSPAAYSGTADMPVKEDMASPSSQGTGVSKSLEELEQHFVYDTEFRKAAIDPDVLALCPLKTSDPLLDLPGEGFRLDAKAVATRLGGTCSVVDDSFLRTQPLSTLLKEDLTDYGVVMLQTHGATGPRGSDDVYVLFDMYRSKQESSAASAWEEVKRATGLGPDALIDQTAGENGEEPQIMFGIYYDIVAGEFKLFSHYDIVVTSYWFMSRYKDARFPNTVFYFNACESYRDYTFLRFLEEHGAACCFGHLNNIPVFVTWESTALFFKEWVAEDAAFAGNGCRRTKTVIDAVNRSLFGMSGKAADFSGEREYVLTGNGSVSGTVTDASGRPVTDAIVTAYRYWNGSLRQSARVSVDGEGAFEMKGIPFGMYLLQANNSRAEGFVNLSLAEADRGDIVIVIPEDAAEDGAPEMPENSAPEMPEDSAPPEDAAPPEGTETPHFLEIEHFLTFPDMTRQDMYSLYGDPTEEEADYIKFDNILFVGMEGHLRVFYKNNALDYISWTAYESSEQRSKDLLAYIRRFGTVGDTIYPQPGQIEEGTLVEDRMIYAGYENTAHGHYTYAFTLYQ